MSATDPNKRLDDYESKRDFDKTDEPRPASATSSGADPVFVIQEHIASSHHYDLRLEVDGVLVSWAVPKGLSTDPRERRLAVQTEDHPMEYADFEGTIGEGEYGGGKVIVWDTGTYRVLGADVDSARDALEYGHLSFWLEGHKLIGGWSLTRTARGWILVKRKDPKADARRRPTSTRRRSVLSDRTVDEV